jgi:hypothetical protein
MTPSEERQVLDQLIEVVEDDAVHSKWERQASVLQYVAGLLIGAAAVWAVLNRQHIGISEVLSLMVVGIAAGMFGAMSTLRRMTANSRVVTRYIDLEKVRARRAQLDP